MSRQILSAGNSEQRRVGSPGYTLIELLVVIAIIAIVVPVLLLTIPDSERQTLETEARRLHALIRYAGDAALLDNQDIALEIRQPEQDERRYAFVVYDHRAEAWMPVADDVLRMRELPANIDVALASVTGGGWADSDETGNRVALVTGGFRAPFELKIFLREKPELAFTLQGSSTDKALLVRAL